MLRVLDLAPTAGAEGARAILIICWTVDQSYPTAVLARRSSARPVPSLRPDRTSSRHAGTGEACPAPPHLRSHLVLVSAAGRGSGLRSILRLLCFGAPMKPAYT